MFKWKKLVFKRRNLESIDKRAEDYQIRPSGEKDGVRIQISGSVESWRGCLVIEGRQVEFECIPKDLRRAFGRLCGYGIIEYGTGLFAGWEKFGVDSSSYV